MRTHQNLSMFSSTKYFLDDVRQFVELEVAIDTPPLLKLTNLIPMWTVHPPSSTISLSPSLVRVNCTATIAAQYSRCTSSWSRLKNSRPASPPLFYTKCWCTIVQLHLERNPLSPSLVPGARPQRYGSGFNLIQSSINLV